LLEIKKKYAKVIFEYDVCFCLKDIGAGKGKYYALNFPLRDGMDDDCYEQIFQPVITKVKLMF